MPPNIAVEPTPNSLRSCVAPAIGQPLTPGAFGISSTGVEGRHVHTNGHGHQSVCLALREPHTWRPVVLLSRTKVPIGAVGRNGPVATEEDPQWQTNPPGA